MRSEDLPVPTLNMDFMTHVITAYQIHRMEDNIVASSPKRAWIDKTADKHAYRCLPLTLANAWGWNLLCPASFKATWNGGNGVDDITFKNPYYGLSSHFGNGILTFSVNYIFRTPKGINLWARGPTNSPKHGICPLEGIIETDTAHESFTMNWKFTKPGTIRFRKGEPFCFILPYPRDFIEQFECHLDYLDSNPELQGRYLE